MNVWNQSSTFAVYLTEEAIIVRDQTNCRRAEYPVQRPRIESFAVLFAVDACRMKSQKRAAFNGPCVHFRT